MKNFILNQFRTSIILLSTLVAGSKIDSDPFFNIKVDQYEPSVPTKDADDWKQRFTKANEQFTLPLTDLYAELPQKKDWPNVLTFLQEKQDVDLGRNNKHKQDAFKMMSSLLKGDIKTAQETYLSKVKGKSLRKWDYNSKLATLMKLGMSTEEASQQIELQAKPEKNKEKEKWKQLLSDGKTKQAVRLLEKENKTENWNKIYKIGKLHDREDLVEKGIKGMQEVLFKDKTNRFNYYQHRHYLDALLTEKRFAKLLTVTKKLISENKSTNSSLDQTIAHYLVAFSHEGGDLLEELKKLPLYKIKTKGQFRNLFTEGQAGKDLGLLVVKALMTEEKPEEALDLLKNLLLMNGGYDPYYRYFLDNFEEEIAFLDELSEWNPYEERPLIWKGHYLVERNELDQAEEVINAAIALDPSDGEQGKDTRMEVYNVLSKLLELRGNEEKSQFFSEVMKAIRAGEVADDFLYLGLHDEAIKRYRAALGHFEDAYCLQSRLAKTLLEKGDLKGAKTHFAKAFKLMPVSFGPVESHCFGCEGIFKDEEAQTIAEKVFKQVITESPDNPRTYYLIAKLYEEQNKNEIALKYYLQAFKRDHNYFNCAKRIHFFMQVYPHLKADHDKVLDDISNCYPYSDLDQLFQERIDLDTAWDDAIHFTINRPIPIEIPDLPTLFEEVDAPEGKNTIGSSEFFAFDGWEAHELLRSNDFLQDISYVWSFD